MKIEWIALLKEFVSKKQFLAHVLTEYSQHNLLRERIGVCQYINTEFAYLFHGKGCLITYRGEEINFDFLFENGSEGRIDGFSLKDIETYCESIKKIDLFNEFKSSVIDLINEGILIHSREEKDILYLKEDYNNPAPFIPDFKWDQDWYMEHGT